MRNNNFKLFLRVWIGITSMIAFLSSWIVLGHTGKPVSANAVSQPAGNNNDAAQLAPLPTLAPLPAVDGGTVLQPVQQQQLQALPQQSFNFSQPRFRTRGS